MISTNTVKAVSLTSIEALQVQCGHYSIFQSSSHTFPISGQTISGVNSPGTATLFQVADQANTELHLAYMAWENHEQDVQVVEIKQTPHQALRQLERGRLRIGVSPLDADQCMIELSQARLKGSYPQLWSNLFQANREELNYGAGLDIFPLLRQVGVLRIGSKEEVLQDKSKRRNYLCAVFPAQLQIVLVIAFVVTRILPLQRDIKVGG